MNKFDHPTRKVFDKTVDTLKRRIQDRHNEIQKLRARIDKLEEFMRNMHFVVGQPTTQEENTVS